MNSIMENNQLPQKFNLRGLLVFICLSLLLVNVCLFLAGQPHLELFAENKAIENIEVCFLVLGFFAFVYGFFTCHTQSIALCSITICFGFILRELDIEKFDFPHWIIFLGSGMGRNVLLAILGLGSLAFLAKEMNFAKIIGLLKSHFAICIYGVSCFLVLSWAFDKEVFSLQNNLIFEELSELNAYFLIFVSSVIYAFEYRR